MTTRTVWHALMLPPWRFLLSRWPWVALVFVFTSAIIWAVLLALIVVTLLLLPIWAILLAALDRRRLQLLGLPRQASGHVQVPREERRHWLNIRLTEPATWREVLSLLTGLVFGVVSLTVLFFEVLTLAVLIAAPIVVGRSGTALTLFGDVTLAPDGGQWWRMALLALLALALFAYLNGLIAALHGGCIRWLTAPRAAEIDERVASLTRSRATIVDAHDRERRRIERDLHDGVQQELVAIAARLGLLELELASGEIPAARAALGAAQTQTERALVALRDTVRGIHPAVLSDRGLAAALEELAGRSVLPVRVEDHGFPRLPPAAETAAYYFVAEAVTNATKHTAAPRVVVSLAADAHRATVVARDNGHGGVDLAGGTGLRGLSERAEALGGQLAVHSPVGGPTVLTLELPLPTVSAHGEVGDADPAR